MILIAGTVPNVASLFQKFNTSPGTWYAAFDLANTFFSTPAHKIHQKQFTFSWQRPEIHLHCSTSGVYQLSRPMS